MSASDLRHEPVSALAYRVRDGAPERPAALLVLLHGVGGNEDNLAALADGVDRDTLVVFPRGRLTFAPGQYGWFPVSFTADGPRIDAAAADASRLALIAFIAQLQQRYAVDPRKTAIAGFSQGGILSASVALTAPEQVAGFAVLSGRILPEIRPQLAEPAALARVQGFVAHCRDDQKLPVVWAERAEAWLQQLGVPHALRLYAGDHGIPPPMARDFLAWQSALLAAPGPGASG